MYLMLFTADPELAGEAGRAGIDGVVIDLESKGKHARQSGFDLQINQYGFEQVRGLRNHVLQDLIVRINPFTSDTAQEVEQAVESGADLIMLPMARSSVEVQGFLQCVGSRCRTIVQIETLELVSEILNFDDFKSLPWDYSYAGLNDLMVASKESFWAPILNGTIEKIRRCLEPKKFGFGGLTVIDGGKPVPCRYLADEMARLRCDIAILRRSFLRDIKGRNIETEIEKLRSYIHAGKTNADKLSKDQIHEGIRRSL